MSRVLVVGAGPAGLAAAFELRRRGIDVHVIDRRPHGFTHPRATVISTRVMELVRAWGLTGDVLAGAVDVEWLMWSCRTLAEAGTGHGLEVGYPTRAQAAAVSPAAPACVAQDHLEAVLHAHVPVERGAALTALDQRPDGVRATLTDGRVLEAEYVIGADGAASTTRALAGIAMHGPDAVASGANVVFRAPLDAVADEHRYGIYAIEHPGAECVLLPAGPGDRWVLGGLWDEHTPSPDAVVARIRAATGVADLPVAIEHTGRFAFAGQLADRFRAGRVLLAGDAAHRVTPRGGTGMNTAILGAYDVAWKLAWVLRGWAPASLLDTYETDRRPYAEHNVARSLSPEGSQRRPAEELPFDLAGRLTHAWLPDGRSTLDLLGDGFAYLTDRDEPAPRTGAVPVAVHRIDRATAARIGAPLLARPDGVPAPDRGMRSGSPPMPGAPRRRDGAAHAQAHEVHAPGGPRDDRARRGLRPRRDGRRDRA